jgi:hypothetical protein
MGFFGSSETNIQKNANSNQSQDLENDKQD